MRLLLSADAGDLHKNSSHQLCNQSLSSTAQNSTAQHSTAQHSTAQHSTAQHSTAQHSTAQHSTAQHSTAQHSTAQHSTAQHSTAQHSTAQLSSVQSVQGRMHQALFICSLDCPRPGMSCTKSDLLNKDASATCRGAEGGGGEGPSIKKCAPCVLFFSKPLSYSCLFVKCLDSICTIISFEDSPIQLLLQGG